MMTVRSVGAVLAVAVLGFVVGDACALDKPEPGKDDRRVRFVNYQPYNVVHVVGSIRSSVQVEFASDEDITHVALGNTVAWEVAVAGNIMFLKAREAQPVTNASVVTTRKDGVRRSYQFELVVSGAAGDQAEVVKASSNAPDATYFYVKFRYPADEAAAAKQKREASAAAVDAGLADRILSFDELAGPRNYKYTARGSEAIEPARVYDNGKITTFEFVANQEMPAIYIVNSDGSESLVPKSVNGPIVHIHAHGPRFILRRGGAVVAITNQNFDGFGIDTGTRTTSPAVARVVNGKAVDQAAKRMAQSETPIPNGSFGDGLEPVSVQRNPQDALGAALMSAPTPARAPMTGWTPVVQPEKK